MTIEETTEQDVQPEAEPEESAEAPEEVTPVSEDETEDADAAATTAEDEADTTEFDLKKASVEADQLRDQLLRARAEFDNYRKRTAKDMNRIRETAAEDLIKSVLPAIDNLERALEHVEDKSDGLAQGVEMVLKQLCDALAQKGLEPILSLGESFDPNVHEALAQQPSDEAPEGVIIQEYQRGYTLGGFILRPAQVIVSSGPAEAPCDDSTETHTVETTETTETAE